MLDFDTMTPLEIRGLMDRTADPVILRSLAKLEDAVVSGDEFLRVEAVGELADTLILERGMGL